MGLECVKEDFKKYIKDIDNRIKSVNKHTNDLDLLNVFFKNWLYADIKIDGYEVNSNVLNLWFYITGPTFLINIDIVSDNHKNQIEILQDEVIRIFKENFSRLIFNSSPFDKFYTENDIALDKYIMDSIAVSGEVSLILEERFTTTLLKNIILEETAISYKLNNNEYIELSSWLNEYYFNLGEVKSYIVI